MFLNKLVVLLCWLIVAMAFQPEIKMTDFASPPKELVFFEGTSVILYHDAATGTIQRSADGGATWNPAKLGKKDTPVAIVIEHLFEKNRVYALSSDGVHYYSLDRGESWSSFNLPCKALVGPNPLEFHAQNPDLILITVETCPGKLPPGAPGCDEIVYYTTDGFKSKPNKLIAERGPCFFAHGKKEFVPNDTSSQGIVCQINSDGSKLAYSTDFFKSKEFAKIDGKEVNNIVSFGAVSKFFLAAVKLDPMGAHVGLITTTDLKTWKTAEFPHEGGLEETAFTILESSAHSLHVDVRSDNTGFFWEEEGTFYTSNSDGTVFRKSLEHTNRDLSGFVDIEQVEGVEGVLIANVAEGHQVRTKISYDDGRTWNYLATDDAKCPGDTSCSLNLFSVTNMAQMGRVFKSPAPGLIAAIGSQGSGLSSRRNRELFVSDNSGLTWKKVGNSASSYQWGNQGNILLSIPDKPVTDEVTYSVNAGGSWETVKLDKSYDIVLTTADPDSTEMKFLLVGLAPDASVKIIQLDFSKLYSRECKLSSDGTEDFEKWYARYDKSGKPNCVMGRMEYFYRKKKDAQCYIGHLDYDEEAMEEPCPCSEQDYECDTDFEAVRLQDGVVTCRPNAELSKKLLEACRSPGDKYERLRGYRLIPGDTCSKEAKGSIVLDDKIEETCGDESFSGSGNITKISFTFDGELLEYIYLKNHPDFPNDETVIARTRNSKIYITHDQGTSWKRILEGVDIFGVFPHSNAPNVVYFLGTEKLYYSTDRGRTINSETGPASPNPFKAPQPLGFHPVHPEWVIYTGENGCDEPFSKSCSVSSYYSTDYGKNWKKMVEGVHRCSWITQADKRANENLIFCSQQYRENGKLRQRLIASNDTFETSIEQFGHIVGFAQEQDFVVVATADEKGSLQAMVTVDGLHFAEAKFPHNFVVDHQQAYTILESPTGAVLMHVTVSDTPGLESGALLKSNYNGTDYVMSLKDVNRNAQGYVDFERMQGLEGVAFANVVWNSDVAQGKKLLKTVITHNDGAEWQYVPHPKTDIDGKPYCEKDEDGPCTLNLHGYTERVDYRDTYSSPSAVGLSVAIGNVGTYLTPKKEGNTYITRDGGISWKEIMKGSYLWEYGDSGSIIALVKEGELSNILYYSLDEGDSWQEYVFSDVMLNVRDISTVQSDTSRKFIIWAKYPASEGSGSAAIQIDFSSFAQRKCVLDSADPDQDDFELWAPRHPLADDNCLFGHQSFYHRKIPGRDCFIGANIAAPHQTFQNCSCTRRDFECDFNYALADDGTCQLVEGYSPPDHMQVCSEMPGTVEYWEPTGYRRIPMTTCLGGKELDKTVSHPCPGREEQYRKHHGGLDGFGLFVAIVLPIILSGVIGYIVWDHYSKRYGQIRLGEEDAYRDQPIVIQYGIIAIAAVAAVIMALPSLVSRALDGVRSFVAHPSSFAYTTRDHFAQSSERYYPVDEDEDRDLLVEDEDDEDAEEL